MAGHRQDKDRHRQRHRIEVMFGHLKDWRRITTRGDRLARNFLSAVARAAPLVSGWLD